MRVGQALVRGRPSIARRLCHEGEGEGTWTVLAPGERSVTRPEERGRMLTSAPRSAPVSSMPPGARLTWLGVGVALGLRV